MRTYASTFCYPWIDFFFIFPQAFAQERTFHIFTEKGGFLWRQRIIIVTIAIVPTRFSALRLTSNCFVVRIAAHPTRSSLCGYFVAAAAATSRNNLHFLEQRFLRMKIRWKAEECAPVIAGFVNQLRMGRYRSGKQGPEIRARVCIGHLWRKKFITRKEIGDSHGDHALSL